TASKETYQSATLSFDKPADAQADTLYNAELCLVPVVIDTTVAPEPQPTTSPKVALFDFAKYDLRPETLTMLDTLAALLNREPMLGLEIDGYTDKKGTEEYNMKLSDNRAQACKDYLVKKGVAAKRLQTKAMGKCCEVQPETTPDGK